MKARVYQLPWTKTTPFRAKGQRGLWSVSWNSQRQRYLVTLDQVEQMTTRTVTLGKEYAEHQERAERPCPHCDGSGWLADPVWQPKTRCSDCPQFPHRCPDCPLDESAIAVDAVDPRIGRRPIRVRHQRPRA